MKWAVKGAWIAFLVFIVVLGLAAYVMLNRQVLSDAPAVLPGTPMTSTTPPAAHPSFIYGRIRSAGGAVYEGRLRWGGDQEAFWGDYFNGIKANNPWAAYVSPERLRAPERPIEVFGIEIWRRDSPVDLGRPFMARFGDIARIEMLGRDVRVTLKSGTVFILDYWAVNDLGDGVRVWDGSGGMRDLDPLQIRTIDFFADPRPGAVLDRLHGTVHTRQGDFTGFVQWNRKGAVGADELDGRTADGFAGIRFDTVRSIARRPDESSLVTLIDGREVALAGAAAAGADNLGVYVDDRRYGRVLVSWSAFERLDFSPGGSGPAYGDFQPGHPLAGSVTTRSGRRLSGRLVYDLDESETTETLDAPLQGVDYTLPFSLVASIVLPVSGDPRAQRARVTLVSGENLELERSGDLRAGDAGMLIFAGGSPGPEYVPWSDIQRIDFDQPPSPQPAEDSR